MWSLLEKQTGMCPVAAVVATLEKLHGKTSRGRPARTYIGQRTTDSYGTARPMEETSHVGGCVWLVMCVT